MKKAKREAAAQHCPAKLCEKTSFFRETTGRMVWGKAFQTENALKTEEGGYIAVAAFIFWYPEPGLNRHSQRPRDFKSLVSNNFTIRAWKEKFG